MGCAQSKVDNEESVSRCKERKILMKDAVVARNAFASGHSGFAISLKNTGAALSDYAHGEVPEPHFQPSNIEPISQPPPPPPPPPPPSMENLRPPPPLPNFSPSPIKRALSMPEIPMKQQRKPGDEIDSVAVVEEDEEEEEHELDHGARNNNNKNKKDLSGSMRGPPNGKVGPGEIQRSPPRTPENHVVPPMPEAKNVAWDYFFMVDNIPGASLEPEVVQNDVRNETTFDNVENSSGGEIDGVEPKTPEKAAFEHLAAVAAVEEEEEEVKKERQQIEHSKTAPPDFRVMGKNVVSLPSVNLMQVLSEFDDHFLKASESAQEVSKMLEATRLHYHSNFADNRGNNSPSLILSNFNF